MYKWKMSMSHSAHVDAVMAAAADITGSRACPLNILKTAEVLSPQHTVFTVFIQDLNIFTRKT